MSIFTRTKPMAAWKIYLYYVAYVIMFASIWYYNWRTLHMQKSKWAYVMTQFGPHEVEIIPDQDDTARIYIPARYYQGPMLTAQEVIDWREDNIDPPRPEGYILPIPDGMYSLTLGESYSEEPDEEYSSTILTPIAFQQPRFDSTAFRASVRKISVTEATKLTKLDVLDYLALGQSYNMPIARRQYTQIESDLRHAVRGLKSVPPYLILGEVLRPFYTSRSK